jgi:hypothetical protein
VCAWLGPVVLAPDVKHENTGDEEEGHHQDRDRANLDSRRIVSVEPPLLVPPARPPVRAAVVVLAPFRWRAPAPAPAARGDDVVRGEPAPTFVALAAGPGILCIYSP